MPSLSRIQKYWLRRPGALTGGLRQLGRVEIRLIAEHAAGLSPGEAWLLGFPPRIPVWIREIVMSIDDVNCIVARSLTPLKASHGSWHSMRRLHTRPLADMLYRDSTITRSVFFSRRLNRHQAIYGTAKRALGLSAPSAPALLARCSVFRRACEPLAVAECFLPEFWLLAAKQARKLAIFPDFRPNFQEHKGNS
ncbi:chorismate--pyruvate lyase family protein [Paralcaligenes ginsengisoli]